MNIKPASHRAASIAVLRNVCICEEYIEDIVKGEPDRFDAVELQGVSRQGDDISVDNSNPDFYSVYLHLKSGGVDCIGDYGLKRYAQLRAREIAKSFGFALYDFT